MARRPVQHVGEPSPAAGGQSTAANGTYAAGPTIDRGKISTKIGLEVATIDVKIGATSSDLINGTALIPFAQARGFDGAAVVLYRAFLPAWPAPNAAAAITGVVIACSGRVTALKDISRAGFTMTVSAWTVLLNVNMGPDVFQAGCLNTHYDANCGLAIINSGGLGASPPQNQWSGSVGASPAPTGTAFQLAGAAAGMADHYFDKGTILFTSAPTPACSGRCSPTSAATVSFAFGFPVAPCGRHLHRDPRLPPDAGRLRSSAHHARRAGALPRPALHPAARHHDRLMPATADDGSPTTSKATTLLRSRALAERSLGRPALP